jgi:RNA polymerase sigma factor (sigma-70 family)
VDEYSPQIYRLALRRLRDPLEAEAVLQDSCLNAYRSLPTLDGRSSPETWLDRIAANQALMRLRKRHPESVSVDGHFPDTTSPAFVTVRSPGGSRVSGPQPGGNSPTPSSKRSRLRRRGDGA